MQNFVIDDIEKNIMTLELTLQECFILWVIENNEKKEVKHKKKDRKRLKRLELI